MCSRYISGKHSFSTIVTAKSAGKPQKKEFGRTLLTSPSCSLHEEKEDHVRSRERSFGWGLDRYPISSIPLPQKTGLREIPITFIGSICPLQSGLSKTVPLHILLFSLLISLFLSFFIIESQIQRQKVNVGDSTTIECKQLLAPLSLDISRLWSLLTLGEGPSGSNSP